MSCCFAFTLLVGCSLLGYVEVTLFDAWHMFRWGCVASAKVLAANPKTKKDTTTVTFFHKTRRNDGSDNRHNVSPVNLWGRPGLPEKRLKPQNPLQTRPKLLQKYFTTYLFWHNSFCKIANSRIIKQIRSHVLLQTGTNQWQQHCKENVLVDFL